MQASNSGECHGVRVSGRMAFLAVLALCPGPVMAAPCIWIPDNGIEESVAAIDTATGGCGGGGFLLGGTPLEPGEALSAVPSPDGNRVYVINLDSSGQHAFISVYDVPSNSLFAPIPLADYPAGIALSPDGRYLYVTHFGGANTVAVFDTEARKVVATIAAGSAPLSVVISPDGKHAYVANYESGTVSVIDTAAKNVVATITVGPSSARVTIAAATLDGKRVYVASTAGLSVIDTATNVLMATGLPAGGEFTVSPDGKRAYFWQISADGSVAVRVVDTDSYKTVATIPIVARDPESPYTPDVLGIAGAPDGKHIYALTSGVKQGGHVAVVDTANYTVLKFEVGRNYPIGHMGVSPYIPFAAFNASLAENHGELRFLSQFTLGPGRDSIDPAQPVTLQIGTFAATIPAGSFKTIDAKLHGAFAYQGVIDGAKLDVFIVPTGTKRYSLQARVRDANLTGTGSLVTARLSIGADSGMSLVKSTIGPPPGVPFSGFTAKLDIDFGHKPNDDSLLFWSHVTLGPGSNGINPPAEAVTLKAGTFSMTIPPGSFTGTGYGPFTFHGVIDGVDVVAAIENEGTKRYRLHAHARHANAAGTKYPLLETLIFGDDSGATTLQYNMNGGP